MAEPVVALLDQVWSSIEDVCATFTPAEWSAPTDLPGWTVKDQLSHLCGIESLLLGRPQPEPLPEPWPGHVRNALGAMNEAQIEQRRALAGEDVLSEFLELTAERLKILAETTPEQMDADVTGPLGRGKLRDFLDIRVMDCFLHEQDMRRATGRPGGLDGEVARFAVLRMRAALPMIVGKRAGAADGSVVAFRVEGPAGFNGCIAVHDGRGEWHDGDAPDATTTLAMDAETFLVLTSGRRSPDEVTDDRGVHVGGDQDLARRVLDSLNVLF